MTALGDLLELLHDADRRVGSFEGEIRDWSQPPASHVVIVDPDMDGRMRWAGGGPSPRATESYRRVWSEQGERVRAELLRDSTLVRAAVRDGDRWWRWDIRQGSAEGFLESANPPEPLPPLLDLRFLAPASLITRFRFAAPQPGMHLNREVLVARATPRRTSPGSPAVFTEFAFDAAKGTMLRRTTFDNGQRVQHMEVLDCRFDKPIDPERFVFATPVGA